MNDLASRLAPALSLLLAAACGGSTTPPGAADAAVAGQGCPAPNPGLCPPAFECTDGQRQNGQAACVEGAWVCGHDRCEADAGAVDAAPDAPSCSKGAIDAARYDASCNVDGDCALVFSGSLCSLCRCPNAAIARASLGAYDADVDAAGPPANVCACVTPVPPVCRAGACSAP